MATIRVATWNLWWRFGPWERRQPMIAEELARVDADVVCLQEVWAEVGDRSDPVAPDVAVDGPGDLDHAQPVALADSLGLGGFRYVWRHAHEATAFGNAILSRHPIRSGSALALPALGRNEEHRAVLAVELATPAGRLPVATTHLNYRWDQSHVRQAQVGAALPWLAEQVRDADLPPVLTGDLNAEPASDEIRTLTGRRPPVVEGLGFFDAWECGGDGDGHTWTRVNGHLAETIVEPDRRIDYVLVGYPRGDRRLRVVHAERFGLTSVEGCHPSDHLGVVADIEL